MTSSPGFAAPAGPAGPSAPFPPPAPAFAYIASASLKLACCSSSAARLLPARGGILGLRVEDAVGVNVEGDLDLRDAARRGRKTIKDEPPQRAVVARHLPLALQDVNLHLRLAIGGCGKHLALARGDGGIARDERGHDAAGGLHAQREGGGIEQPDPPDGA